MTISVIDSDLKEDKGVLLWFRELPRVGDRVRFKNKQRQNIIKTVHDVIHYPSATTVDSATVTIYITEFPGKYR